MAIHRMLQGMAFDDQAVKAMTTAYDAVLAELGLTQRHDPLTETIAGKIIALCQMGECDAARLTELTLKELRR